MYIKSLTISKGKGGGIIRSIIFHKGTNLIVDETTSSQNTETGNNVGKTTVLRLIDFCLGGKKEKIYQDPEFQGHSSGEGNNIKQFLERDEIYVELVLVESLEKNYLRPITIGRNFLNKKLKIQEINGKQVADGDFGKELGWLILGSDIDKPSFRQIICRNIRHSPDALNRTLKPLHSTTSNSKYEILYLYWLGITADSSKDKLELDFEAEKKYYAKVEDSQGYDLNTIKQKIIVQEKDIHELNAQRDRFNLNKNYIQDLKQITLIKQTLNEQRTQLTALNIRKDLILESQAEIDKTSPQIETEKVRALYAEAKSLLPNLQTRFEAVLAFHFSMMKEKKQFIGKDLPKIGLELQQCGKQIEGLIMEESRLNEKLQKTGAIEELEILITKLTQKHEGKGRLEKAKELLEKSQSKIDEFRIKLERINKELESQSDIIGNKLALFNEYFSDISNSLYGEKFLVSHEFVRKKGSSSLKLNIHGLEENPGTGGKKGEIAAFDLAYIGFAEELNIPHLNFVLHDQIENIHDNQINIILSGVVKKINCQYIVPVLRDKLPENIDPDKYSVLSLSQSDKLFKLP